MRLIVPKKTHAFIHFLCENNQISKINLNMLTELRHFKTRTVPAVGKTSMFFFLFNRDNLCSLEKAERIYELTWTSIASNDIAFFSNRKKFRTPDRLFLQCNQTVRLHTQFSRLYLTNSVSGPPKTFSVCWTMHAVK